MKLPSEGHDLVKSERKEAGCTADGHEEYWQCSKCHRFFSDEEGNTRISEPKVISKTGHSLKKMERKEANCTESGYEAYWKCQNEICQKLFSDEGGKTGINQPKEIKATGHKYEEPAYIWSADNLKCTAERKCTACDDVEMETADATATVVQEKNCILPELTMFHVTFKNGVFKGKTKENVKTAEATGHDLEKVEKKVASCTKCGHEPYWKCQTCEKIFSDETGKTEINQPVEIPASGHNLEKIEKKEVSCTESGYEGYWKCQTCEKLFLDEIGKTEINQPVEILAPGHNLEEIEKKEATCTESGHEGYWKCQTCEKLFSDEVGKTEINEPIEIPALGHNLEEIEKKEASCTEPGHEGYWKCQTCQKFFLNEIGTMEISNPIEIKTTGHNLEKIAKKEASCTETGYEEYWKCQTCGKLFSDEAGKTAVNEPVEIQALGHILEKIEKKEASCIESGYEGYWKCSTCEKLFADEVGRTEISQPVEISATGHDLEKIEKKEAGCTESGYKAYWKCQTCGKLFSDEAGTDEIASLDDIQIPAKGHEEGNEWLSDAEKHWKECAVCQEKTEEADHVYVNETDTVCEICGYERTIKSEVPEILEGHNGKWQMNSGKTLSFRSSAPFAEFISVTIDDVVVDEKNYDKAEGSTIITLHPEFLSTLSVGTHTLSIDSASGSAVTEFTIEEATAEPSITETPSVTEAPSPTTTPSATTASTAATVTPAPIASPETKAPKTGDESNVAIWMLLLFLSAEGIIVALQKSKKKTR